MFDNNEFIDVIFNKENLREKYGLYRVNKDRYDESLTPDFTQNKTQLSKDGTYIFQQIFDQKPFNLEFAFDGLSAKDFNLLPSLFACGEHRISFSELPQVEYEVTVQNPPKINYLVFDEDGQRVYKGELSVQMVSYDCNRYFNGNIVSDNELLTSSNLFRVG